MRAVIKLCLCLFISIALFTACKKSVKKPDPKPQPRTGVTKQLYNQPLDTIKAYLEGDWWLVEANGGLSGKDHQTYSQTLVQFNNGNFKMTEKGNVKTSGPIKWEYVRNLHKGDSTWMMTEPIQWKFNNISNDSLFASMNAYDGYGFLLVRP